EVDVSRKTYPCGDQAHRHKRKSIEDYLSSSTHAFRFDYGQHLYAGSCIVFAIHPSDGEKMGELPQEHYQEEHQSFRADLSAHGGPAYKRRHRSGKRSYKRARSGLSFERRV